MYSPPSCRHPPSPSSRRPHAIPLLLVRRLSWRNCGPPHLHRELSSSSQIPRNLIPSQIFALDNHLCPTSANADRFLCPVLMLQVGVGGRRAVISDNSSHVFTQTQSFGFAGFACGKVQTRTKFGALHMPLHGAAPLSPSSPFRNRSSCAYASGKLLPSFSSRTVQPTFTPTATTIASLPSY